MGDASANPRSGIRISFVLPPHTGLSLLPETGKIGSQKT